MSWVEAIIKGLITIAVAMLVFALVVWALLMLGIALPANVITIIGVIIVLLVILYIYRLVKASGATWLP